MTNYEKLVSGGPQALAYLIAKTKLEYFKRACAKCGVTYDLSAEKYDEILKEHYEYLVSECEE